jgi:hypothetical protein
VSDDMDIEVAYWDCEYDHEQLVYSEIEEAVEAWADRQEGALPETVKVYGFARMDLPPTEKIASRVLEHLYGWIDDEYGDPNGSGEAAPLALLASALQFAEAFRKEYTAWACEQVTSRVVRVADYYTRDT